MREQRFSVTVFRISAIISYIIRKKLVHAFFIFFLNVLNDFAMFYGIKFQKNHTVDSSLRYKFATEGLKLSRQEVLFLHSAPQLRKLHVVFVS